MLDRLYKNPLTSPDIKASVEDLRVLGKKDFKNLLKYRLAVREDVRPPSSRLMHALTVGQHAIDVKVKDAEEFTEKVDVAPLDEEEQIEEEVRLPVPTAWMMTDCDLARPTRQGGRLQAAS